MEPNDSPIVDGRKEGWTKAAPTRFNGSSQDCLPNRIADRKPMPIHELAALGAALGQGKAVASAAEVIARNPGAAGEIRGALILGLVLIESLVIYVLLISLILFFLNPFVG